MRVDHTESRTTPSQWTTGPSASSVTRSSPARDPSCPTCHPASGWTTWRPSSTRTSRWFRALDGELEYVKRIAAETQICRPLAVLLEDWLRSLLDWSPETRGRGGEGAGEITVFSQLNNILQQSWISVFSTITCQTIHLPLQVYSPALLLVEIRADTVL